jgi:hypothetical protein
MPSEHPLFIATLRAVFRAEDEIEAIMIADQIKVNGEKDLEEEDGDTLDVTQVTTNTLELQPEEVLAVLRRARNLIIRTRTKEGYDLGRLVDQFIYSLKQRLHGQQGVELAGYDWGEYMDIVKEVLAGGNPIH